MKLRPDWLTALTMIVVIIQIPACTVLSRPQTSTAPMEDVYHGPTEGYWLPPIEYIEIPLEQDIQPPPVEYIDPLAEQDDEDLDEIPSTSEATLALLDNALRFERRGDLETAAATLERALRIEPRNAQLWHHLATIRLEQGQLGLAAQLAARSSSLVDDDIDLIAANRRIIELARMR